jgi:hypothetical protein
MQKLENLTLATIAHPHILMVDFLIDSCATDFIVFLANHYE